LDSKPYLALPVLTHATSNTGSLGEFDEDKSSNILVCISQGANKPGVNQSGTGSKQAEGEKARGKYSKG